jgi:hypothetical protein
MENRKMFIVEENELLKAKEIKMKRLLLTLLVVSTIMVLSLSVYVSADPNGTRPTQLTNVKVVSVNNSTMLVSGTWITAINSEPIVGYPVYIYYVGYNYFTKIATVYTTTGGNFSATIRKPSVGVRIQIDASGNGAYSRPFPTYNRP